MPYSLWLDGVRLGTTDLDVFPIPGRRAGVLQPTAQGVAVLPSITAVVPAMLDFNELCEARGLDASLGDEQHALATLEQLSDTGPVLRMRGAISRIARLELRDDRGANVPWSYILVTDMDELRARTGSPPPVDGPEGGTGAPIRYLISATFDADGPMLGAAKGPRALVS